MLQSVDVELQQVQAVITAPTRELANQIYHEVLKITKHEENKQISGTMLYRGNG